MEKVVVKVPGSCGELIQGFYGGSECLVSYAIDCYSKVTIKRTDHFKMCINHKSEKAYEAYNRACNMFNLDSKKYEIDISSDIPVGKGMASSTADIVGVIVAVATMAGKPIQPDWVGKMAADIEPTDNIMFKEWVLFNHLSGELIESYKAFGDLSVVILEMDEVVDTKKLRQTGAFSKESKPNPSRALELLKEAVKCKNLKVLGQAMKLSAIENQSILFKPYLEELIGLSEAYKIVGINSAHSGSVLGIVFETDLDPSEFLKEAESLGYLKPYKKRYIHKIIEGGPSIETF